MLLVQSIQITDKFGFGAQQASPDMKPPAAADGTVRQQDYDFDGLCVNLFGVIISCLVFLAVQVAVLLAWAYVWNRKRHAADTYHHYRHHQHRHHQQHSQQHPHQQDGMSSVSMSIPVGRTDSMCKLYDSGYAKRY